MRKKMSPCFTFHFVKLHLQFKGTLDWAEHGHLDVKMTSALKNSSYLCFLFCDNFQHITSCPKIGRRLLD